MYNELTVASDDRTASAPVCVLPPDAVVLFMKTNDIWLNLDSSILANCDGIEVLQEGDGVSNQSDQLEQDDVELP